MPVRSFAAVTRRGPTHAAGELGDRRASWRVVEAAWRDAGGAGAATPGAASRARRSGVASHERWRSWTGSGSRLAGSAWLASAGGTADGGAPIDAAEPSRPPPLVVSSTVEPSRCAGRVDASWSPRSRRPPAGGTRRPSRRRDADAPAALVTGARARRPPATPRWPGTGPGRAAGDPHGLGRPAVPAPPRRGDRLAPGAARRSASTCSRRLDPDVAPPNRPCSLSAAAVPCRVVVGHRADPTEDGTREAAAGAGRRPARAGCWPRVEIEPPLTPDRVAGSRRAPARAVVEVEPGGWSSCSPSTRWSSRCGRAGLDLDLGHVPWLGCVVRFRYV